MVHLPFNVRRSNSITWLWLHDVWYMKCMYYDTDLYLNRLVELKIKTCPDKLLAVWLIICLLYFQNDTFTERNQKILANTGMKRLSIVDQKYYTNMALGWVQYQFLLHSEKWYCTRRLRRVQYHFSECNKNWYCTKPKCHICFIICLLLIQIE